MKVVENYICFPVVHENPLMLKFEMCAPQLFLFWLLSRESGVSFTEAQPGSILTALCFEIAYLLLRNTSAKKIWRELKIQMFPLQNYELLVIFSDLHLLSRLYCCH